MIVFDSRLLIGGAPYAGWGVPFFSLHCLGGTTNALDEGRRDKSSRTPYLRSSAPDHHRGWPERQHQSLGYRTPRQIYQEGLWICGRSASPTGCASPASRASSEGGQMLAFARIPTGATANEGFNIDQVNNRFAKPAVALTATGADIETGRVTP